MAALYEIASDIQQIMLSLEDAEGELTPEMAEKLDQLQMAFEEKVENVLRYRVGQVAAAEGIDREIQRLTALRNGYNRRADSLKAYVFRSMQALNIPRVVCRLFTVWIQKNGRPCIELAAAADGLPDIPEPYRRVTVTFDSQKAYEDWKAGTPLPKCITVIDGFHLRVK